MDMAKIMIPSTLNNNDSKQLIFGIVDTLTDLDPNIIEIRQAIDESNLLVKEITQDIEGLKTRNTLINLSHLAVLEKKLPFVKTRLEEFTNQIKSGKAEAESLTKNYNVVINTLTKATNKLDEVDPLRSDALSIIALNNIKVKNIQNQINNAYHQIQILERFRAITLYHVSETISLNKKDKDMSLIVEIKRVADEIHNTIQKLTWASIFFAVLSGYNVLASNYHIQYESVKKIAKEVSAAPSPLLQNMDGLFGMSEAFSSGVVVLGTVSMTCSLFALFKEGLSSRVNGMLIISGMVVFIAFAAPRFLKSTFFNSGDIQYTEIVSLITFDFWNFGFIGTAILLMILNVCIIYGLVKFKEEKQYKSLVQQLSDSEPEQTITDNDHSLDILPPLNQRL